MELLFDILTTVFVLPGCVLILIGGYGMIRLKDVFERMHAAGMVDTLGMALIIIGLMFQGGLTLITFKLFLIIVFVLYTSPVVTHALARAAIVGGVDPIARKLPASEIARMQDGAGPIVSDKGGASSNS